MNRSAQKCFYGNIMTEGPFPPSYTTTPTLRNVFFSLVSEVDRSASLMTADVHIGYQKYTLRQLLLDRMRPWENIWLPTNLCPILNGCEKRVEKFRKLKKRVFMFVAENCHKTPKSKRFVSSSGLSGLLFRMGKQRLQMYMIVVTPDGSGCRQVDLQNFDPDLQLEYDDIVVLPYHKP